MRWLLALLLCVAGGCGKHAFNRDDLDISLSRHHIDLRWGRIDHAAQAVMPPMRAAFMAEWTRRLQGIELQDVDVTGVVVSEDGDHADVVVTITWVDRASMSVVTSTVTEKWLRTDSGWLLESNAAPLSMPPAPAQASTTSSTPG